MAWVPDSSLITSGLIVVATVNKRPSNVCQSIFIIIIGKQREEQKIMKKKRKEKHQSYKILVSQIIRPKECERCECNLWAGTRCYFLQRALTAAALSFENLAFN